MNEKGKEKEKENGGVFFFSLEPDQDQQREHRHRHRSTGAGVGEQDHPKGAHCRRIFLDGMSSTTFILDCDHDADERPAGRSFLFPADSADCNPVHWYTSHRQTEAQSAVEGLHN